MKFELLIRNATVIDGTRAPRFAADIGVSSGRISRIGKLTEKGEIEIDASGKIAAPGCIASRNILDAKHGGRSARRGRDRPLDRPVLRAGERRADRGSDRGVPAAY